METGDPKQVAVLALLAVGAVGFLVTRLGARGSAPVAIAGATVRKAAPSRPAGSLTVMRDPFSHPKLAVKPTTIDVPSEPPTTLPSEARPSPLTGDLPKVPFLPTAVAAVPLSPDAPPKAEAEAPKKAPVAVVTTVALEATAGATDAVAFLSVDGAESRAFRANEFVKGAVRVVRVDEGAVLLAGAKGKLTLGVGERKSL